MEIYTRKQAILVGKDIKPATTDEAALKYAIDNSGKGGGGGGSITIDTEITENGENPVTGGAIYAALAEKKDNDFIVTLQATGSGITQYVIESDKSIADIYAAKTAGKDVYGIIDPNAAGGLWGIGNVKIPLVRCDTNTVVFTSFCEGQGRYPSHLPYDTAPNTVRIIGTADGWFWEMFNGAELKVTFEDSGGSYSVDSTIPNICTCSKLLRKVYAVFPYGNAFVQLPLVMAHMYYGTSKYIVEFSGVVAPETGSPLTAKHIIIRGVSEPNASYQQIDTWDYLVET